MTEQKNSNGGSTASEDAPTIAESFVTARLSNTALDQYPGDIPANLSAAYVIQDLAIDLWPDQIGGWKVGRIPPHLEDDFGCDRIAGPIFNESINDVIGGNTPDMPVFVGGFAAVEAEFVAVIASDTPADKSEWSTEEAASIIGDVRIGLEVASSPFAGINDFGPALTVSDFGNNAGLVVGATIVDWQSRDPQSMACETFVDNKSVGTGGAYGLTGGIVRSVQFMLGLAAARGRPLQAGSLIATGQTTGIHEITLGQTARIPFADDGEIQCRIVATRK